MKKVLIIAPHMDDELLGCGGTILAHRSRGDEVHWCIITEPASYESELYKKARDDRKHKIISEMSFSDCVELCLPATELDGVGINSIVKKISAVISRIEPEIVYLPHCGDVHSDHRIIHAATLSCTKWFRYHSIVRILAYETLSETEQGYGTVGQVFAPNVYTDITPYLEKKIRLLEIYRDEMGKHPFPRSEKAVKALANYRGATAGFEAAEAFMLLRERLSI